MFKNILVPIDCGELSNAAVRQACCFAKEAGAADVLLRETRIFA